MYLNFLHHIPLLTYAVLVHFNVLSRIIITSTNRKKLTVCFSNGIRYTEYMSKFLRHNLICISLLSKKKKLMTVQF